MRYIHRLIFLLIVPCVFSLESDSPPKKTVARKNGTVGELRVIGGEYAQEGQFPYHITIFVSGNFRCGASLISSLFAITAAHCFFDRNQRFDSYDMKVWVGHISIFDPLSAKIITGVDKVYIPRTFGLTSWGYMKDDIAILKLSEVLDIPQESVLHLPSTSTFAGELGVVSGHGLNWKSVANPTDPQSPEVGDHDGLLRFTDLEIITNSECTKAWGGRFIPANLICTKTGIFFPGALCNGDSGGALVIDKAIVGVLSFGSIACQQYPEVFTRVSSFSDFIDKAVNDVYDPNIDAYNLKDYYSYQIDDNAQIFKVAS